MVIEYRSGFPAAPWPLLPASDVIQLWREFSDTGTVRDVVKLEDLRNLVLRNITRLQINTDVAGHTEACPESLLREFDLDDVDHFVTWAIETPEGGWRISDYGLPKLQNIAARLKAADTPGRVVRFIDAALNVVHPRSDMSSWFIEGGRTTLNQLAND